MATKKEIDDHNKKVLAMMIEEASPKLGAKEIRSAYFKNWYESCKDIYNKERRKKRKEKKKLGLNTLSK